MEVEYKIFYSLCLWFIYIGSFILTNLILPDIGIVGIVIYVCFLYSIIKIQDYIFSDGQIEDLEDKDYE